MPVSASDYDDDISDIGGQHSKQTGVQAADQELWGPAMAELDNDAPPRAETSEQPGSGVQGGRQQEGGTKSSGGRPRAGGVAQGSLPFTYLPTQAQLRRAGRLDLAYALQIHGHERVARRCGLKVQRRGLNRNRLSVNLVRTAIQAGASSTPEIRHHLAVHCGVSVTSPYLAAYLLKQVGLGKLQKAGWGRYGLPPQE
eukprot:CAMPEP_0202917956 /NCGR_PEP_ID=MMETSP1392-20130828/72255_1 /ASSEMBLY_ACC=CAM_ASM_000868 /TAXON_ID=225041 /ORGANISM="Chlamydomonas chlamydogama, Strain SAG 11-48b" /LENGTH=197 /DNA_ID=CAMNT_0049610861 /DNA_START=45 /DNA_END=635 /DNA_ORIENTATION=-